MSRLEFIALLPLSTLALMVVVLTLVLCVWRHAATMLVLTLISLLLAFIAMNNTQALLLEQGAAIAITPMLSMDNSTVFFSKLIILSCMIIALSGYRYFEANSVKEGQAAKERQSEEFYLLLLMACLGAVVLVASQHFAGFFLGLELLGVSLFAMIAYPVGGTAVNAGAKRHSLEAAIKYLVLSSVASAFLLLGMAFIYAQTGALTVQGLQQYFSSSANFSGLFLPGAIVLFLVGVGFKLSLVPFHWWTPDVYQGAPTPVTALIATVAKGAMVVALVRFFIDTNAFEHRSIVDVFTAVVVATILVGNLLALTQHNIKRLLAYSSIAHIGYLFVAFLAVAETMTSRGHSLSIEAVAIYIVAYFVTTLAAFAVVGAISDHCDFSADCYDLRHYRSMFWRRPWVTGCFILVLLSLAGIPLTLGFIGKFYIFASGAESQLWLLLSTVIVGSAMGLYYYLRVIIILVQKESQPEGSVSESHWMDTAMIVGLTGVLVLFGIYPAPLISWIPV